MSTKRGIHWSFLIFALAITNTSLVATAPAPSPPQDISNSSDSATVPNCGVVKLLLATLTSATPDQPWLATSGRGEAFLMFTNQCNGTDLLLLSINVTAVPDVTHVQLCKGSAENETGDVVIDFERVLQLPQLRATRFASLEMLVNSSAIAPLIPAANGTVYDYYMVVITPDFPKGSIRGQVYNFPVNAEFISNEGEVISQLAGGNILASAGAPEGTGFFKLAFKDSRNGFVSISYSVILHGVPLAFAASIHEGEEGLNGPTVVNFGQGQTFSRFGKEGDTLLYGNQQIMTSLAFRLFYSPRSFYVFIQSGYFTDGAVRGQLVMPRPIRQNFTFVGPAPSKSGAMQTRQGSPFCNVMRLLLLAVALWEVINKW